MSATAREFKATHHEDRARAAKATKIVRHLASFGVSDETELAGLEPAMRARICAAAGVREASDRTWSVVAGILAAFGEPK